MNSKIILLTVGFMLTGCMVKQPEVVEQCSGNTLRGCKPVVYFDLNSAVITKKEEANLEWTLNKLNRWPNKYVKVTGHADSIGDVDRNLKLSKERAQAIKNYFVKNGIASDRVIMAYKGEMDPVCVAEACRAQNRRAELELFTPNRSVDWNKVSDTIENSKKKCVLCEEE